MIEDVLLHIATFVTSFNAVCRLHRVNKNMKKYWNDMKYVQPLLENMKEQVIMLYNNKNHVSHIKCALHIDAYIMLRLHDYYSIIVKKIPTYDKIVKNNYSKSYYSGITLQELFGKINKTLLSKMFKLLREQVKICNGWDLGPYRITYSDNIDYNEQIMFEYDF